MKQILTILLIGIGATLSAQTVQDTIKKPVNLDEVVISANKTEEMKRNVASQMSVINAKQIQFSNVQTSGDIMSSTGQIMVQKSQQGGGSPIIRGFEASRVLLVVDGVRMNNLIYRGGHLQNIITLDPSMLDRVEVVFGPSSTVYGSDALGGTMHFITKKPTLNTGGKMLTLNAMQRYASVNNGLTSHINFNLGFSKFASLTSVTYNNFGDLRMGKAKNMFYDTIYGTRDVYVERINGKDSVMTNSDKYVQKQSGYTQIDILQKFLFKQSDRVEHQLNIQYSNSSDVPRYDRLTEKSKGIPSFAQWYYGPQTRLLTAYDLNINKVLGFDKMHIGANYQKIQESRNSRRFGSSNLSQRVEDVSVIGYNIDFQNNRNGNRFRVGLDGQANTLKSTATKINVNTNAESKLDTRYPNGNNTLNHNALYFTHTKALNKKFILNDGARVGMSVLKSDISDNSFFNLPVTSVEQKNITYSAYLGLIFNPTDKLKLSYLISSGYRVPNIDDLSKIFETTAGSVIIPNPDLEPEQTLTNEISLGYKPTKNIRVEGTFWYTMFNNAITTKAAQLNGNDSVLYDGKMSKVYSNQNTEKAVLWGYSLSINADLSENSQAYFNLAYTKGTVTSTPVNTPLDHIAPMTGNLGYIFAVKKLLADANIQFNGKKDIKDYSNSGEDNQVYAPLGGMPAWMTINLKLGYRIHKNINLQAGVDNILDTQYRTFASGIHAPGRNIYVTLRLNL